MEWNTITADYTENICVIRFNRPEAKNCINDTMVEELERVFEQCEKRSSVVVLEGNEKYFCFGADFHAISEKMNEDSQRQGNPGQLYDLWSKMTQLSCIVIAHVKGSVNAGGMGFVSASDLVIADESAMFSLSELLFGLMPAMVLPFLIRKVGYSKANFLTLTTKPVDAVKAYESGLVDLYSKKSDMVLKQNMVRLKRIPKDGIARYKAYVNRICPIPEESRQKAIEANIDVFSDPINLQRIYNFSQKGIYPWETE